MKLALAFLGMIALAGTSLAQQPREKPKELEALGLYAGDWTSDVTSKPAVWTPKEIKYRTHNHAEFVLNGWFLRHLDTNKKAYRYVRFSSLGQLEETIGQWNEAAKAFEWQGVNDRPGQTRTSTSRLLDNDAMETHIVAKNPDGKVQIDLTIKSTRRK